MSDLINGLYPKQKNDNAPEWVIGKLSINVEQFREWMKNYLRANPDSEWINVDMKVGRSGKPYASLDTWQPKEEIAPAPATQPAPKPGEFTDDDIPF